MEMLARAVSSLVLSLPQNRPPPTTDSDDEKCNEETQQEKYNLTVLKDLNTKIIAINYMIFNIQLRLKLYNDYWTISCFSLGFHWALTGSLNARPNGGFFS